MEPLWEHHYTTETGVVCELSFFGDGRWESSASDDDLSHLGMLTPSEAVNLASALLQFSTANASWWKDA